MIARLCSPLSPPPHYITVGRQKAFFRLQQKRSYRRRLRPRLSTRHRPRRLFTIIGTFLKVRRCACGRSKRTSQRTVQLQQYGHRSGDTPTHTYANKSPRERDVDSSGVTQSFHPRSVFDFDFLISRVIQPRS